MEKFILIIFAALIANVLIGAFMALPMGRQNFWFYNKSKVRPQNFLGMLFFPLLAASLIKIVIKGRICRLGGGRHCDDPGEFYSRSNPEDFESFWLMISIYASFTVLALFISLLDFNFKKRK